MVNTGSLFVHFGGEKERRERRRYVPWHTESKLILYGDEPCEYPQADAGRGEDGEDPDVELDLGPLIVFRGWTAGHCS
jgi:hypothetical protein